MPLPRKLQFKDRFVYHLTRQIEGDCEGEPILFPDDTTPIKFVVEISQDEFTALLSACMTGADLSYPENSHEVVWTLLRQVECPVSICDEILECLQPAFDEINDQLSDISEQIEVIDEKLDNNAAKPPVEALETANRRICGGAAQVLALMNTNVLKVYAESESGEFDNSTEAIAAILSGIPVLGALPFDELILMANAYFENQVTEYQSDYTAGYNDMLYDLYCKLLESNGVFTFEVWGAWLTGLQDRVPGNRASYVISRFAPAYQTFFNQIADFIAGENSLETFFDELYLYYLTGAEAPSFVCDGAACGLWRHTLEPDDFPSPVDFITGYGEWDTNLQATTPVASAPFWTGIAMHMDFVFDTDLTQIVINQSAGANIEGKFVSNRFLSLQDSSFNQIMTEELPIQDGVWNVTLDGLWEDVRYMDIIYIFSGADTVIEWDEVTLAGNGTNPFV